jgi:hypothetical protein
VDIGELSAMADAKLGEDAKLSYRLSDVLVPLGLAYELLTCTERRPLATA